MESLGFLLDFLENWILPSAGLKLGAWETAASSQVSLQGCLSGKQNQETERKQVLMTCNQLSPTSNFLT